MFARCSIANGSFGSIAILQSQPGPAGTRPAHCVLDTLGLHATCSTNSVANSDCTTRQASPFVPPAPAAPPVPAAPAAPPPPDVPPEDPPSMPPAPVPAAPP